MKRKRVLLVDDSSTALLMHQMLISDRTQHQVLTAKDGAEAVETAVRAMPDLIIMDVVMPRMSGYEACKELRSQKSTRAIPIILLTTQGQEESVETGYESGCNDYLTKPVNPAELLALVESYIGTGYTGHEETQHREV
jgi:CheY-like chemotaxis protein